MNSKDRGTTLANSFKNPTKLEIVTVLIQKGRMTVTQMSRIIGTTKSNLYQAIAELVSDGLVNPPEVKVTKNYVEKFYTINEEAFSEVSSEEWKERMLSLSTDDLRDLVVSFLLTQSVILKIMAEELNMSNDLALENIRELFKQGLLFLSYSKLSNGSYTRIASILKTIESTLSELEKTDNTKNPKNTLLLVGIPSLDLLRFLK
ncbi:MAG: ArsR/SmtB family transcription factor [Thermoplasmataceae archaeon]